MIEKVGHDNWRKMCPPYLWYGPVEAPVADTLTSYIARHAAPQEKYDCMTISIYISGDSSA